MVGRKKDRPCTVIKLKKDITDVGSTTGFKMPRSILLVPNLSIISVVPTLSDIILVFANAFCSGDNQVAVSTLSVSVKNEMTPTAQVTVPSIAGVSNACLSRNR